MLGKLAAAVFIAVLLARTGLCQQCYDALGCTGNVLPLTGVITAARCCAGTDAGMSFSGTNANGDCNGCIVHGFAQAVYNVSEEDILNTRFELNAKGVTNFPSVVNIQGTITAAAGGTASTSDFEALNPISVANEAAIRLFTRNDEKTLEYNDFVILTFTPADPATITGLESVGEYVRTSAIVNIIDNDQLQINFKESDYSITEGGGLNAPVLMRFRNNQNAFNITFSPVTIEAAEGKGLGIFINSDTIELQSRATAGTDFNDMTITVEIPAATTDGTQTYEVPDFFQVNDDDIDEIEQSFAIVATIGNDVPDAPFNFSCFQLAAGEIECFGRRGATEIRITDNDPMIIGFTTRSQTVSEGDARSGSDFNELRIDVATERTSERGHTIIFRHLESASTAVVQSNVRQGNPLFDALFGNEDNDPIEERFPLLPGSNVITSRRTSVRNDFRPEGDECYTIGIFTTDVGGARELFTCNDDADMADNFFCLHTICIINDDAPFVVAFVQTTYTVVESEGPVEVCVNLTFPGIDIDILEEVVAVNVINNESSVYIPDGARLATPDVPDFLSRYFMMEGTDYAEQTTSVNAISGQRITAVQRMICYNQPIYDDGRLEVSEFAGLTLNIRGDMQSSTSETTVQTTIQPMYNFAAIEILDDDVAVVGLERTFYREFEDVGLVELCAVVYSPNNITYPNLTCPIEFPFSVSLSTGGQRPNMGGTDTGSGGATDSSSGYDRAVAPMDYAALSAVILDFDACDTRQCVFLTVEDDLVLEMDESLEITLNRTAGLDSRITLDPTEGEVVIVDTDDAVVGLERTFYSVMEDVGVVEVCTVVFLPDITCPIGFPFIVNIFTLSNTAESPMDYGPVSTSVMFDACERRSCVNVSIVDDLVLENTESFFVSLERAAGLDARIRLDPVEAEIEIIDNDRALVGLERTLYTVEETVGLVQVCAVVFEPDTDCPVSFPFDVRLITDDGSAVQPMDYVTVNAILSFASCDMRQCVDITIENDEIPENVESFFALLERTLGLDGRISLNPVEAEIMIIDTNVAIVGLERTFYRESEDVGVVEVCAVVISPNGNIPCPIMFPFNVSLSTTDDTAVTPMDYQEVDVLLFFEACQMRSCVNVVIEDDEVLENIESLIVNLERTPGLVSRIELDPVRAVIEITDNDNAVVGFERTFISVSEGVGVVELCAVVISPEAACPIDFPFEIDLSTDDNTAVSPMDYISISIPVRLTFMACDTRRCRTVPIEDDQSLEVTETFTGTLERPPGLDTRIRLDPIDTVVEITDNDEAVVGLERTMYMVEETVGVIQVCAVVSEPDNDCPVSFPFDVSLSTMDDTAVSPMDYASLSDVILTFAACDERQCVDIIIEDDSIPEELESFDVTLERTTGLDARIRLDPVDAVVEIIDSNMAVVGLEMTFYQVSEDVGVVEVCAIVIQPVNDCPIAFPFEVQLFTSDNTAVSPPDYDSVDVILPFARCEMRRCTDVLIVDDEILENPERLNIHLERTPDLNSRIMLNPVEGEIEILDNDDAVIGFERTFITVSEGVGVVELCAVVISPEAACPIDFPFEIDLSTDDNTAVSPMDYLSISIPVRLMFMACDTRRCRTVPIEDDQSLEVTETFTGTLERPPGLDTRIRLDPIDTVVEITDNDEAVVGLERTFYNVSEGVGIVEVCAVVFQPVSDCPVSFSFDVILSTIDGTAVSTMDYDPLNTVILNFPSCGTESCTEVVIIDDDVDEPNENLFVVLERTITLDPRITLRPTEGEILIVDNDIPINVGYELTVYTTTETDGFVELCVVLFDPPSGVAPRDFTLTITTTDGTAMAPADYRAVNGETLQFTAGESRNCHRITINQDRICEDPNEDFFSNIALLSGDQPISVTRTPARVIIDDTNEPECNEITVGYELTTYTTTEGEGVVELCVAITDPDTGGAPREFTLLSTTRDGSARAGVDYVSASAELSFVVRTERVCHNVEIIQDDECEPTPENFFADLTIVRGNPVIILDPESTEVFIDDANETDCDIVVGYERTFYSTPEDDVFVELCVIIYEPSRGGAPRSFILSYNTQDYTAEAPDDYLTATGVLEFGIGDTRECYSVRIVDDDFCDPEQFFSNIELLEGDPVIFVNPAVAEVAIQDSDCEGMVNDTLTGDPLMTVPILTSQSNESEVPSLCYEIHGRAGAYFNLISDECTTVNAFYEKAFVNSSEIDLNVVTKIGVRAVGSDNRTCHDIEIGLATCSATIDNVEHDMTNVVINGIRIRRSGSRVRLSVPNCADTLLVMWVFCSRGQVEDPVTWEYYNVSFIRFVVMRGLNLNELSHGLIGQFWNVPVSVEEFTGRFDGVERDDDYVITVRYPGSAPRSFVGIWSSVTWELLRRPCYFVGSGQGGRMLEIAPPDPNDPVIEGQYTDYIVDSLFATQYRFSHFNNTLCT